MRLVVLALTVLLALVAPGLVAPALAQTGNPSNDALLARNAAGQREAFQGLLRTNGLPCAAVSNLYAAGLDRARTAYWDIRCRDGGPWRIALPAQRWATPRLLACGLATGPGAGACFQPLGSAVAAPVARGRAAQTARAATIPASCTRACANQPRALVNACRQHCAAGNAIQAAAPAITGTASAIRGRFGFIYTAEPPSTAFGFTSGQGNRLNASMEAIRGCEAVVGRNQCRIAREMPNACGALAQAVSGSPAMLRRSATGVGQTREQAEAQALHECRLAERPGSGIVCRIAASGC